MKLKLIDLDESRIHETKEGKIVVLNEIENRYLGDIGRAVYTVTHSQKEVWRNNRLLISFSSILATAILCFISAVIFLLFNITNITLCHIVPIFASLSVLVIWGCLAQFNKTLIECRKKHKSEVEKIEKEKEELFELLPEYLIKEIKNIRLD